MNTGHNYLLVSLVVQGKDSKHITIPLAAIIIVSQILQLGGDCLGFEQKMKLTPCSIQLFLSLDVVAVLSQHIPISEQL